MTDTARWDEVLAAGGRIELRYSAPLKFGWAAASLLPFGVGLVVSTKGDVVLGVALMIIGGLTGGAFAWQGLDPRPVVTITDASIAFRERRRERDIPWSRVEGAVVYRFSLLYPVVVLRLKRAGTSGRKTRAVLPHQLEVGTRDLRAWIDHQAGWPVRR